jgi:4-aminobutyrate aminotransferase
LKTREKALAGSEFGKESVPRIRHPLPGPKARKLVTEDLTYISPSYTRSYPLVVESARGAVVRDVDGNLFLDFAAGIAVCATGHSHPEVVRAIAAQADKLIHISGTDFYVPNMVELARKLCELTPGAFPKKVYFGNSGAEAIEAAMKLARWHTRRKNFIAFYNSFHGRTFGALSLTSSKTIQRKNFGPFVPGAFHSPYGYCYRCPINLTYPACEIACATFIENTLFRTVVEPESVAAIVVEPIQGEGGYVVPPREFFDVLTDIADRHGILIIADEIQSGMGRTGRFWASEHFGFVPDIIATAKGIASGLPLSAIIAREDLMDWTPGAHASTFGGNPVSCAAALKTIELIESEYMENARVQGEYLAEGLARLRDTYAIVGDARGLGLMQAIEIIKPRATRDSKNRAVRDRIIQEAFQRGLLLLGCGENSVRFCPPLSITRAQVDCALSILDECLSVVSRRPRTGADG